MSHSRVREEASESNAVLANVSDTRMSFSRRRPAVIALAAIVCGILIGQVESVNYWLWLLSATVFMAFAGIALLKRMHFLSGLLILSTICFLFAFRTGYQSRSLPPGHIRHSLDDGRSYRFYGEITDWPDVREQSTRLTIRVDSTGADNRISPRMGSLLLHINTSSLEFQYGDGVIFDGEIRAPPASHNPGGFDYARSLNWKDISGIVYVPHHFALQKDTQSGLSVSGIVGVIRSFILGTFERVLYPEQAALASGFLIGETSGVSERVYGHFRRSGTLHLLAVSGSNVAIALLSLRIFLWPFPLGWKSKYLALILGALIFCYVAHTDPSVVRATVMIILFLVGRLMQFRIDYHNLIAAAGALILLWNPNQLFSVGFQLSFVVAWALILFINAARELYAGRTGAFWFKFGILPVVVALGAQLSAMPIILFYFGQAPLWSMAANIVIAPLVSGTVLFSLFVLLAELIFPQVAFMLGSALNAALTLVLEALETFGAANAPQIVLPHLSASVIWSVVGLVFLAGAALTNMRARRALIWTLALSPIVFAISLALQNYKPERGLWVLSTRTGICALAQAGKPVLFLADLNGDARGQFDYLIGPQLIRSGATKNLSVVQSSADFATLTAALTVQDSFAVSKYYVSDRARALVSDELTARRKSKRGSPESYRLEFCAALDSLAVAHVLNLQPGSHTSETNAKHARLAVGRSVTLFRDESLMALFVSASPDESELVSAMGAIAAEKSAGFASFVIVAELNLRVSSILQRFEEQANWRVLAPRKNLRNPLTGPLAAKMQYLSETGAVFITTRR